MIKADKQLWKDVKQPIVGKDWALPEGQLLCRACITPLAETKKEKDLQAIFLQKHLKLEFPVLSGCELTPYQAEVSEKLLETYQNKDSLVHAVTGARKTEMIYKIVASMFFESKGNVAIVSPRLMFVESYFLYAEGFYFSIASC